MDNEHAQIQQDGLVNRPSAPLTAAGVEAIVNAVPEQSIMSDVSSQLDAEFECLVNVLVNLSKRLKPLRVSTSAEPAVIAKTDLSHLSPLCSRIQEWTSNLQTTIQELNQVINELQI